MDNYYVCTGGLIRATYVLSYRIYDLVIFDYVFVYLEEYGYGIPINIFIAVFSNKYYCESLLCRSRRKSLLGP